MLVQQSLDVAAYAHAEAVRNANAALVLMIFDFI
jgi:hypothetical protein